MEDEEGSVLQKVLVSQIAEMARAAGFSAEEVIDYDQCRSILDATAGDIEQACQLYWDDLIARRNTGNNDTTASRNEEETNHAQLRQRTRRRAAAAAADEPRDSRDQEEDKKLILGGQLRSRRLLDQGVNGSLGANNAHQLQFQRARAPIDNNVERLAAHAAAVLANHGDQVRDSASVSDDESGGVWRMVGGIIAGLDGDEAPPARKRRRTNEEERRKNIDDEGYISENDWLWEALGNRKQIPLCTPFDVLWGLAPSHTNRARHPAPPRPGQGDIEGNIIVDDADDESSSEGTGIPRAWLNAGFALSDDGMGLALPPPLEDDVAFFAWQQQANERVRNTPPPPFHCGSITALLAIVTGLLYSGVSCQRQSISKSSPRTPFKELTYDDKKREFESRLADALASLLLIAAKASVARKEKALSPLKMSKDPNDVRKFQKLEAKLRLCPTCWWEVDGNGEPRLPVGRDADRHLQVATSYTNIEDLRSYVISNMRSFTSKGGCALFLETITRIHGRGVILKMMEQQSGEVGSLIQCKCEDSNKSLDVLPQQLRQRSKTREIMQFLPKTSTCLSVHLLSLLLTGKVCSSLTGWSTGLLGLGLLSDRKEVGTGLARPNKPVWIIEGPTTYSVVWMSGGQYTSETFGMDDVPGSVVQLTHFSSWPGRRNTTTFRLATSRTQKNEVAPESVSDNELDAVEANEEDAVFYMNKYRLWRFRFTTNANGDNDSKTEWIPYFRLSDHQKFLVETKLGPKLNTILWKRWPQAIIEGFDPETPPPIV